MSGIIKNITKLKEDVGIVIFIFYIIILIVLVALLIAFPIALVSNYKNNPDWVNTTGWTGVVIWGISAFIGTIVLLTKIGRRNKST